MELFSGFVSTSESFDLTLLDPIHFCYLNDSFGCRHPMEVYFSNAIVCRPSNPRVAHSVRASPVATAIATKNQAIPLLEIED